MSNHTLTVGTREAPPTRPLRRCRPQRYASSQSGRRRIVRDRPIDAHAAHAQRSRPFGPLRVLHAASARRRQRYRDASPNASMHARSYASGFDSFHPPNLIGSSKIPSSIALRPTSAWWKTHHSSWSADGCARHETTKCKATENVNQAQCHRPTTHRCHASCQCAIEAETKPLKEPTAHAEQAACRTAKGRSRGKRPPRARGASGSEWSQVVLRAMSGRLPRYRLSEAPLTRTERDERASGRASDAPRACPARGSARSAGRGRSRCLSFVCRL